MNAKDFKALIAQIPDDEEVYYSSYDIYSEDWCAEDDFRIKEYFLGEQKIYTVCGAKPYKCETPDAFLRKKKIAEIFAAFPQRKNWTLKNKDWGDNKTVEFAIGGFVYPFGVSMGREKMIASYVGDASKMKEFDSWKEFFADAEPIVIKAAQKQREELESLLEK